MATQNAPYYGGGQARSENNGMAIASLILGIISIVVAAFITGTLAIVFGGLGVARAKERGGKGRTMSIWGIALGAVGIVLWVALLAANHGQVHFYAR